MRRDQRGSVLMLVPAAVLVLLVLASICVDSAIALLGSRQLDAMTAAAANDIASTTVDDTAFYRHQGSIELRQADADRVVALAFDRAPTGFESMRAEATVTGRQVVVRAEASVRLLFARAIPGVRHTTTVRAATRAILSS
jgi:hypothetical protein